MVVKKTKSGKLSVSLSFHQRAMLEWCACKFIEENPVKETPKDILGIIYYTVIEQFFIRTDLHLKSLQEKKILMTIPEGLAIMRMLRHSQDMDMINLKSALHKTFIK